MPVTKLGRLVKDKKIMSLEEIYLYSLPIKVLSFLKRFRITSLSSVGWYFYRG